jgi:hypothetical protein
MKKIQIKSLKTKGKIRLKILDSKRKYMRIEACSQLAWSYGKEAIRNMKSLNISHLFFKSP